MIFFFVFFLNFFDINALTEKEKRIIKYTVGFGSAIFLTSFIKKIFFNKKFKNLKKQNFFKGDKNKNSEKFTFDISNSFGNGESYEIFIFERDKKSNFEESKKEIIEGNFYDRYFYECAENTNKYNGDYNSNIFYKNILALRDFCLNTLKVFKQNDREFSIFCRDENGKIKFRENFILEICKSEGETPVISFTTDELNKDYFGYEKSKTISFKNKNSNVWALSQRILFNTSYLYGGKSKNESNEANLISSFGYTSENNKKEFVDEMHRQIFEQFDYIYRNNQEVINVLCMPAIGLGVFAGDPKHYWRSMLEILSKNQNLIKGIEKKKIFIYYNPGSEIKGFKEFNKNEKLIKIFEKDIFDFAYKLKMGKFGDYFNISILNPSNKINLKSVESLGVGSGGENNIDKSTSIRLNDFFEELYKINNNDKKI